ncbi:MAG: sporulation transcriptional regulator SpoIIID [Corallococcus sp.]|nr:sporulation transcriptional regulator SpoIIID [Corallococcus sp.]
MKDYIVKRVTETADYVIKTGCTVRAAGKYMAVSKSTVHKDLKYRLYYLDKQKYHAVAEILNFNLSERHLRGGLATKNKYKK